MFGISFGKNKSKTSETATKLESGTQAQTGTNTTNTTGSTSQTGSQSSVGSGTSNTTQGTTGSQLTTQTGSAFGQDVLKAVNGNIGELINRVLGSAGSTTREGLGDFDAESFISSTMQAARTSAEDQLGESIRGVGSTIGGNASENSMTALLANRMANATGANLAGVQANAVKTAQDILGSREQLVSSSAGSEQNALAQILNALKGGETSTTGAATNTGVTTGSTNTTESNTVNTNQQSQTQQTALEIINQLLATQSNSTGTSVGTNKKSGGGFSLGL